MPQESYATLLNKKLLLVSRNTAYLAIDRNYLATLLAPALTAIYVNEPWYLERYPDVSDGISRGVFLNAAEHFSKVGYFEHRMPYMIEVDEPWYLDNYPDIAAAVKLGSYVSGADHFYQYGYREGRFPHANFGLKTWADSDAERMGSSEDDARLEMLHAG